VPRKTIIIINYRHINGDVALVAASNLKTIFHRRQTLTLFFQMIIEKQNKTKHD